MERIRNFSGVQYAALRQAIDPAFNELHDELEEAYYGPRGADGRFDRRYGWINGFSRPWNGYDCYTSLLNDEIKTMLGVQPGQDILTGDQAKQLFDYLHGTLFEQHKTELIEENAKRPVRDREDVTQLGEVDAARLAEAATRGYRVVDLVTGVRTRPPRGEGGPRG